MARRTPQDRLASRMADIERDYERQVARGKDPAVARAKRRQREADARDDLARRTGGDRTATRTAERESESALTSARSSASGRSAARRKTLAAAMPKRGARADVDLGLPTSVRAADMPAVTAPTITRRSEAAPRSTRRNTPTPTPTPTPRGSNNPLRSARERNAENPALMGGVVGGDTSAPASAATTARATGNRGGINANRRPGGAFVNPFGGGATRSKFKSRGGAASNYAKGGSVKKSIDGIATRGKTRAPTRKK